MKLASTWILAISLLIGAQALACNDPAKHPELLRSGNMNFLNMGSASGGGLDNSFFNDSQEEPQQDEDRVRRPLQQPNRKPRPTAPARGRRPLAPRY